MSEKFWKNPSDCPIWGGSHLPGGSCARLGGWRTPIPPRGSTKEAWPLLTLLAPPQPPPVPDGRAGQPPEAAASARRPAPPGALPGCAACAGRDLSLAGPVEGRLVLRRGRAGHPRRDRVAWRVTRRHARSRAVTRGHACRALHRGAGPHPVHIHQWCVFCGKANERLWQPAPNRHQFDGIWDGCRPRIDRRSDPTHQIAQFTPFTGLFFVTKWLAMVQMRNS